ncbi:MAG: DUF1360 domain-containing protein [Chthoniobacterales bacterium]|nr:DUF1360 domain-containing protein [Chthoniobacterales bacterium]MBA3762025.1 DUF1360 domain-containing protein [Chthoniobacterales bacterium]
MATPRKTARRRTASATIQREARSLFEGYSKTPRPLGGYAALVAVFTVGLAGAFAATQENEDELPKLSWSDLLLFGIATHKLSRIATKDLVTSPFRAPFVKFKKSAGAGEVEEEARGEGLQEAVGDLITCPYCIAPWIASALVFASARAPRATRVIGGIFAITAGSDFLNRLYAKTKG